RRHEKVIFCRFSKFFQELKWTPTVNVLPRTYYTTTDACGPDPSICCKFDLEAYVTRGRLQIPKESPNNDFAYADPKDLPTVYRVYSALFSYINSDPQFNMTVNFLAWIVIPFLLLRSKSRSALCIETMQKSTEVAVDKINQARIKLHFRDLVSQNTPVKMKKALAELVVDEKAGINIDLYYMKLINRLQFLFSSLKEASLVFSINVIDRKVEKANPYQSFNSVMPRCHQGLLRLWCIIDWLIDEDDTDDERWLGQGAIENDLSFYMTLDAFVLTRVELKKQSKPPPLTKPSTLGFSEDCQQRFIFPNFSLNATLKLTNIVYSLEWSTLQDGNDKLKECKRFSMLMLQDFDEDIGFNLRFSELNDHGGAYVMSTDGTPL
uniref:Uncharacterized protein n=1 Tax=Parascaris equorum TaxID=6256 RepID=A0A914S3N8_PAREQ